MKRLCFLLVCILMLSFSACAQKPTVYTVIKNGVSYTVNTENATVFDGENTYTYTLTGDEEDYELTVLYPNGSSYTCTGSAMGSIWGASDDYDEERYASGALLCDVITKDAPQEMPVGKILISLLLFALGVFHIARPRTAWFVFNSWRFRIRRNAEPSDIALTLSRAGGFVYIIAAIIFYYV